MLKGLRSILPLYRPALRSWSRTPQHDAGYRVKRVRILQPVLTLRRAQTAAVYLGAFATYWHFVLDAEIKDEEAVTPARGTEKAGGEENGAKQVGAVAEAKAQDDIAVPDEIPDDAIFIPLGRARQRPKEYYKGSDQEWQSFMELAHDKKRNFLVRHQLVEIIGKHLGGARQFQRFLGRPMLPRKYWLNVDYPDGPPPEYERGGLEITDDYIAWSIRPVSADNYVRLRQALYPTAITSSVWASYSLLWTLQVAKVKKFLNIESKPDTSRQPPLGGFVGFQRSAQRTTEQQPQSELGIKQSSVSNPPERGPEKATTKQPSSSPDLASAKIFPIAPSLPQQDGSMFLAFSEFKRTLRRTWKPTPMPAPRGTCFVSGLVELVGPKGTCVLEVMATYHPKENKFVSIGMSVRRAQPRQQGPRGGP